MDLFEKELSAVELLRIAAINSLFKMKTLESVWPYWRRLINSHLDSQLEPADVLALGDNLSHVFRQTGEAGRGQSSVSSGGAAWEALVCWYLNLCLSGTRTVVVKHKKALVPAPLSKAITVKYGNIKSNTESDLLAITMPDTPIYTTETFPKKTKLATLSSFLNDRSQIDFSQFGLTVIQCKTNWNDNAQIPMLWDMVYRANGFSGHNISVGDDNFSISNLANFSYSFVTVPTTRPEKIKAGSTCVNRVRNLSGGNYWGRSTESGVAESIKEFFARNVSGGFSTAGLRSDLQGALQDEEWIRALFRL